jgi:hypothetical protein
LNGKNVIEHATAERDGMNPGIDLVRVLDLSGLDLIYAWAQSDRSGRYSFLADHVLDNRFPLLLDDGLQNADGSPKEPREQGKFIESLFQMVNEYRRGVDLETGRSGRARPFHPSWVSLWGSLNPAEKPERWLETLGIAKSSGRWLALMRYNMDDGISLWRPSVLDSAPSGYFFPSPTWPLKDHGGATLNFYRDADGLTPEFIHVQQDMTYESWLNAGSVCKKTSRVVDCELPLTRADHRTRLSAPGIDDSEWMKETV